MVPPLSQSSRLQFFWEQIDIAKIELKLHFDKLCSKYTKPTIAIACACLFIVGIEWIREISWRLLLAPFIILCSCILVSMCISVLYSEPFKVVLAERVSPLICSLIPPQLSEKVVAFVSFIWWRARILLQTSFKRVFHSDELRRNKFLQPFLQPSNARSVLICVMLLFVYSSMNNLLFGEEGHTFNSASHVMLRPAGNPSISKPFIFLHVPGSGGVSFRKAIHEGATSLRSNRFLPCFDGLKCAVNTDQEFNKTFINAQSRASQLTITQREMRCAAVIGGHFKMSFLGVLAALDRVESFDACPSRHWTLSPYSAPQFNIVIILRNPLRRIISHYYRFGQTGPNKDTSFTDLSTEDLQSFLRNSGENLVVSYLTSSKIADFASIADATKNAMNNLQLCTVGIFEYWEETAQLLRHQNRWLQPPTFETPTEKVRESPSSLDPSVVGLLINRLVAEMRLYEIGLKRFRRQVRAFSSSTHQALPKLKIDPTFNPSNENYYRHFVPSPFPLP